LLAIGKLLLKVVELGGYIILEEYPVLSPANVLYCVAFRQLALNHLSLTLLASALFEQVKKATEETTEFGVDWSWHE